MRPAQMSTRNPVPWLVLLALLVAVVVIAQAGKTQRVPHTWPRVQDLGPGQALSEGAFLLTSHELFLVWQPRVAATPLELKSISQGDRVRILPYADAIPRRWQAAAADSETFHLVWLEHDGRLRSALLSTAGTVVRGPIELTSEAALDFAALGVADGRLIVLWRDRLTRWLSSVTIDRAGRPGPTALVLRDGVETYAAGIDAAGVLHLAWLVRSAPNTQFVRYAVTDPGAPIAGIAGSLHSMALAPQEYLTSFALGLDRTHAYVLWGASGAERPDIERVSVLSFPLGQPETTQVTQLILPADVGHGKEVRIADLAVGPLAQPSSSHPAADLRWPRPAPGQPSVLPMALSVRTVSGWRPGVTYWRSGTLLGYQVAADLPADAGPPAVTVGPAGEWYLAWQGLQGAIPHLYVASSAP